MGEKGGEGERWRIKISSITSNKGKHWSANMSKVSLTGVATVVFFSFNFSSKAGNITFAFGENPVLSPAASRPMALAAFDTTTTFASPRH